MASELPISPIEEISSETLTEEMIASYEAQGFTLTFAEEVMRYDLSALTVSSLNSSLSVSYLPWNRQNTPAFFSAYTASFQDRPGFPGWHEARWVSWTADDPTFRPELSFLAIAQDQTAGFITSANDEEVPERNGYIIQMGVHPQWRRKGLGAALLKHTLQAWKDAGKEAVILHVNVNNPGAIQLYLHAGFQILKRRGRMQKLP